MPSNKRARQPTTRSSKRSRSAQNAGANTEPEPIISAEVPTLNVQALTASITAAVSEGVQAALASAQLGTPPAHSTAVDHVVNNAVQDLVADQGTISDRPISTFSSVAISLAAKVSDKLKGKIWAEEFVDFGALLSPGTQSERLSLSVQPAGPSQAARLCLEPFSKAKRIQSLGQWVSAFNTFVAVYTDKCKESAPQLMKYCEVVRDLAAKSGDWQAYDEQFRFLRQGEPSMYPCGHIHWEL